MSLRGSEHDPVEKSRNYRPVPRSIRLHAAKATIAHRTGRKASPQVSGLRHQARETGEYGYLGVPQVRVHSKNRGEVQT